MPLAVILLALAAACGEAPRQPASPEVPDAMAAPPGSGGGVDDPAMCDTKTVESLGKDVWGPNDRTQQALIKDFTDAVNAAVDGGDYSQAQALAFELLEDVSEISDPGTDESDFTKHVLLCANLLTQLTDEGEEQITNGDFDDLDFTTALDLGSFGVRGCGYETGPAPYEGPPIVTDGLNDAIPPGPEWTIEPYDIMATPPEDPFAATWCNVFDDPATDPDDFGETRLIWGQPDDDIATDSPEQTQTSGFRWEYRPDRDLPAPDTYRLLVTSCVTTNDEGFHLLKGASETEDGFQILPFAETSNACPSPLFDLAEAGLVSRFLNLARVALGPRPLHADAAAIAGGLGGLAGSLSPFVGVDPVALIVSFVSPVPDEEDSNADDGVLSIGQEFSIRVLVTAAGGTPMPDVEVVLTVDGNEGSTVVLDDAANDPDGKCENSECIAETDETGVVHFTNLTLNKSGGYRLRASVKLIDGSNIVDESDITASTASTLFHVTGN